jgi:uncharacterized protein YjiK
VRIFAGVAALAMACRPGPGADGPSRPGHEAAASAPPSVSAHAGASFLDRYDFAERLKYFDLPGRLDEISGLAFTPDGRLFAHDDERARVYELLPATGEVGKRFDLGRGELQDDFEGIAIAGERFFLISSTGKLYEFREGSDRGNVEFRVTDSGVGRGCEVEGLDYEAASDALLIACKVTTPEATDVVVYVVPLDPGAARPPAVKAPKSALAAFDLDAAFDPSGIAATPSRTWLLVSGRHEAIIEIDRSGVVLGAVALRKGRHPQPEGIALGADGTLYISDEKNGQEARLTVYAPHPGGPGR